MNEEAKRPSQAGDLTPEVHERLDRLIEFVDSEEGRARVRTYLKTQPYPQYEASEDGRLVQIAADGTFGYFINRKFHPESG